MSQAHINIPKSKYNDKLIKLSAYFVYLLEMGQKYR